jgi:hypothetical protein
MRVVVRRALLLLLLLLLLGRRERLRVSKRLTDCGKGREQQQRAVAGAHPAALLLLHLVAVLCD